MKKKLIIIGAGPAGLAAAISAAESGLCVDDMLIIEREAELGGVLNQCIHAGFGEHSLGKLLTGTEYAEHFINRVKELKIPYITSSTVLALSPDKEITVVSSELGYTTLKADAIILAMGCRERSHGSLRIAGTRPAGIFSAGTVQRFINTEGYLPGKRVVVFGSGDIGLVTARRLALEGADVIGVYERKSYPRGLDKNVKECLDDFKIPFYTNKMISEILGKERIEGVIISDTNEEYKPKKGTGKLVKCDTLVLSLGLIPDNIITLDAGVPLDRVTGGAIVDQNYQTELDGIFACGNVLHIHDLVDYITRESAKAGKSATLYLLNRLPSVQKQLEISHNCGIKYTVPQRLCFPLHSENDEIVLSYRVSKVMERARIELIVDGNVLYTEQKLKISPSRRNKIRLTSEMLRRIERAEILELNATED